MEISSIVEALDKPDAKSEAERLREEKAKKEADRNDPPGQVVDIARPAIEEHPDTSKFAAEYDSKVDREKRGPTGRDKAGAPVPNTPAVPAAAASQQAGGGGKAGAAGSSEPEKLAMSAPRTTGHSGLTEADDGESASQTGSGRDTDLRSAKPAHRAAALSGDKGENGDDRARAEGQGASVPHPNLNPSREMLQHAIGAGQGSMDYLKDLDDGDSTALNAKKYKFASFFNRLKTAVAQQWNPTAVYVQHDPSGNVYGVKDRVTVVRVTIKPDGGLVASNIVQSSGIGFLDDEAIDAFKKAQPFANPPAGLIGTDGQIQFTFGFVFELSGRTSFKVYKYK